MHQYYLGPQEPGISRFNEMARRWCEAGHDVTVVAGTVSLSTGQTRPELRGRIVTEERDGPVRVLRCHVPGTYAKSYFGRRFAYAIFTVTASIGALRAGRADVIIATSPPLFVVIPGWLAARAAFRRTPWIFEVRDLWPESAVTTGVASERAPLTRFLYWLEAQACRSASRIVALTPAIAANLAGRGLARAAKIAVVPNGADLRQMRAASRDNDFRRNSGWDGRTVALYAGAHGRANALHQLIDAAEILKQRDDILIALVGDGQQRRAIEDEIRRRGLTNIRTYGPVPKERIVDCINAADIGLAVLQRNPTFRTVYPNKVFDYMACARPIVVAIDGAARDLVCEQSRSGVFAEPEDGRSIADAIARLADAPNERAAMGERGRQWVERNLDRDELARRYLALIEDLVRRQALASKE